MISVSPSKNVKRVDLQSTMTQNPEEAPEYVKPSEFSTKNPEQFEKFQLEFVARMVEMPQMQSIIKKAYNSLQN